MQERRILKAPTLAKQLDVPVSTIRFWTREGCPCLRVGRLRRFELEPVLKWLEERGKKKAA